MQGLVSRARRGRTTLLAVALLATGCTALAGTELGRGLGESCESDSDCQHAVCQFNEVTTVDRAPGLAVRTLPMRRAGSADEVAEAIAWLLSDAASYMTASLIDVTGGR